MSEAKRKLVRMIALLIPIFYLLFGKLFVLVILIVLSLILILIEVLRRTLLTQITKGYFKYLGFLAKTRERQKLSGTSWLNWGMTLVVLVFSREIALVSLFFLILGDSAAALVRYQFKIENIKLFGRGVEGSLAMLITCLIISLIAIYPLNLSLGVLLMASVAATIIELLPLRVGKFYIDDNFSIGLITGLVLTFL
jgi:dolichol kinase